MNTDVNENAAQPVVRCKPHGIDASKCIVRRDDRRAAERAAQPAEGEPQDSFTSIPLLDSAVGRAIVEATCAEFDVRVRQLHQLVKAEQAQIGKHRKRGLPEAFEANLDERT